MNVVDVIFIALVLLALYRGWHKGLVSQIFELGGGFLGLFIGVVLGPRVASAFTNEAGIQGALISLFVVFALVSLGQAGGYILGHRFSRMAAGETRLKTVDAGLGAGFGALVTLVSFWLVGSLLVQGPTPEIARAFQRSKMLRGVNRVFPQPPNVLAYLRQYLDTSGFPQVFAGLPRAPAAPVRLPSDRLARQAVEAARGSTMRILVPACGGTQLGSGWVAGDNLVMTNAHVVSGGSDVTVEDEQDRQYDGYVVLFDPRTDIAAIRTEGLTAEPLSLSDEDQERGAPGATLGYPGARGGQLVTHRAAVQDVFEANGYDIYGRREVTREVYELRSPVRQGDSGGPFVTREGDVAGMVFAASTTDDATGYALTVDEIADEVRDAGGRSAEADTDGCTR